MFRYCCRLLAIGFFAVVFRAVTAEPLSEPPVQAGPVAESRAEALDGMERLQTEIQMLKAIKAAQTALLQWNEERMRSGSGPAVLSISLCKRAAIRGWCRDLPATFGANRKGP